MCIRDRAWFDQALSFEVLAAETEAVYQSARQELRMKG